jgi:hypothetical protein
MVSRRKKTISRHEQMIACANCTKFAMIATKYAHDHLKAGKSFLTTKRTKADQKTQRLLVSFCVFWSAFVRFVVKTIYRAIRFFPAEQMIAPELKG